MIECYKPVTDLTNDEIKFIINKIFNPKAIKTFVVTSVTITFR